MDGCACSPFYNVEITAHYFTNSKINVSGFIYNQKKGNAQRLKIGYSSTYDQGCGWVATYNALLLLGKYHKPCDIIHRYERCGISNFGKNGIYYFAIIDYMYYAGCKVAVTYDVNKFDLIAKKYRANILLFSHSEGNHYIALEWKRSRFIGYNTFSWSSNNAPDFLGSSIKSFLKQNNYKPIVLLSFK